MPFIAHGRLHALDSPLDHRGSFGTVFVRNVGSALAWKVGSMRVGSARAGTFRAGSARIGTLRVSKLTAGSEFVGTIDAAVMNVGTITIRRTGTIQFARFGSFRAGSARIGTLRSGSARIGTLEFNRARSSGTIFSPLGSMTRVRVGSLRSAGQLSGDRGSFGNHRIGTLRSGSARIGSLETPGFERAHWIGAEEFVSPGTEGPLLTILGTFAPAWRIGSHPSRRVLNYGVGVPRNYGGTVGVEVWFVPLNVASRSIVWAVDVVHAGSGNTVALGPGTFRRRGTISVNAAGSKLVKKRLNTKGSAGAYLGLRVAREGSAVADTMAGSVYLLGVKLYWRPT